MKNTYHKQENLTYTCPMHPEIVQDKPGICPECGMSLVPVKSKPAGHEAHGVSRSSFANATEGRHAGHSTNMFKKKFWWSLILTIPVVAYSELVMKVFGWQPPMFPGAVYLPFLLGSTVFFYGGWIFVAGAWRELRAGLAGMMMLIAIAILAAYTYSVYATFAAPEHTLFWELTTLITIMLLGHWLEMRAVSGAQGALKELAKLLPDTAEVIRGGSSTSPIRPPVQGLRPFRVERRAHLGVEHSVSRQDREVGTSRTEIIPLSELKEGDLVLVKPGGKVPTDGVVIEGTSELNESMITGESKPVSKAAGAQVIAGTINGDGSLKVKVNKIGEKTFLAGVMRLVSEAQASKSKLQILSDRAAFYLTIIAIGTGITTFVAWLAAGAGIVTSTERLVAVLVVACPHALGLAVPLVASISTTMAARNGLLVKQRLALEAARTIGVVLFDKTGTLTEGQFGVANIISASGDDAKTLQLAASVDAHSEHPVARAIVKEAEKRGRKIFEAKNFQRIAGKGVAGGVSGKNVIVGNEALLSEAGIQLTEQTQNQIATLAKQGKTVIYVIEEKKFVGALALADIIRPESREAIKALKDLNIKVAMITGDSEDVAAWVAQELDLDEYFAKVLPGEKAGKVKLLQSKGLKVAMVGDGVNDAPALTQADVGIAIGAGTNVAIESAGIILVKNDPSDIPKIIRLSNLTYKKMLQNLFWATGYNVVAIPLAAGVLASKGFVMQPALAAVFMSVSTVIVAFNAMLMRKEKV